MVPKDKSQKIVEEENPSVIPIYLDHLPLVDSLFKVIDCECEFDFHEFNLWLKQKYIDKEDPIRLWETLLPLFSLPKTHHFPDLITWCKARYDPVQRTVSEWKHSDHHYCSKY